MALSGAESPGPSAGRDPRLDFFRGVGMLIILLAHVRDNSWALWIPARFGFSDATEIFVFCSGMASAYAFGKLFATRGLWLGTVRIVYRAWQVYWAHIGIFIASAALLAAIDWHGWGVPGRLYIGEPFIVPFFEDTGQMLWALLTLTYVPPLFDILPMYLVILALIPVMMACHAAGGVAAAGALSVVLWLGAAAGLFDLPAMPDGSEVWFFNPFGWQLIFFTGFGFGMGWLPVPPVSRPLVIVAIAVLVLSLPLAWFRLYLPGHYLPLGSPIQAALAEAREAMAPLRHKTPLGILRYAHFLAFAYAAWVAVGPRGLRLSLPLPLPTAPTRRPLFRVLIATTVIVVTTPYAHIDTIPLVWPALDEWSLNTMPLIPDGRIGLLHVAHFAAWVVLAWTLLPERHRCWLCGEGWLRLVAIVRTVGTQSLAVFMTSIPLAIVAGLVLDWTGRGRLSTFIVNMIGFAILAGVAYLLSWIKGHPWRRPAPRAALSMAPAATPAE